MISKREVLSDGADPGYFRVCRSNRPRQVPIEETTHEIRGYLDASVEPLPAVSLLRNGEAEKSMTFPRCRSEKTQIPVSFHLASERLGFCKRNDSIFSSVEDERRREVRTDVVVWGNFAGFATETELVGVTRFDCPLFSPDHVERRIEENGATRPGTIIITAFRRRRNIGGTRREMGTRRSSGCDYLFRIHAEKCRLVFYPADCRSGIIYGFENRRIMRQPGTVVRADRNETFPGKIFALGLELLPALPPPPAAAEENDAASALALP